ncbi:MAG: hypothetical protein K2X53_00945 [Alphaproteobacteria bacterium]|nr:hypothetical protein [Alphaproteobacteria bacterium]
MALKKSLLALSLLASTSGLYAADSSEKHFRSGFYLGAMEGLSAGQAKMSESYKPDARDIPPAGLAPARFDATKSISRSSFVSELLVGGRYLFENGFFPGFEIAASFANHKFENDFKFIDLSNTLSVAPSNEFIFKAATKRRYSIVPSVVLGWTLSNQFNLFAKLGMGITKYDTRILNDLNDAINPGFLRGSTGKTYYSFVPALGLEYSFSRHVSFVASVSYEVGSKPEFTNSRLFQTNPIPMTDSNKLSTRVSIFTQKIGLLVKF